MTFTARQVLTAAQLNDLEIDTLTTTGNVTIGGTISGGAGGSDGQVQYNNGGSFGGASGLYYQDSTGRVGIGTTSPSTVLHVNGAVTISSNTGVGNSHFPFTDGRFYYTADPETGGTGDHVFRHYSGGSYVEQMRILENGNVGIGTTSPTYNLHVPGTVYLGDSIIGGFTTADADEWPKLEWLRDTSTSINWDEGLIKGNSSRGVFGRTHFGIHFHQDRSFAFHTSGWDTEMEIRGDGMIYMKGPVGINDSTPSYTLDVGGSGRYTGTLYFGSSAGSRIQPGTNGASDTINLVSDETYVTGQLIAIDTNILDFRIGPVSTMKMADRQVYWGYTGNQGLGTANTIVGTNFGVAYGFDNSSSSASIGTGWSTILNVYATPAVTGGNRWGNLNTFTCWVLWGFSAYSNNTSTKFTKVVANSSTLDYATSDQYFFYNTTFQHQGWSFFDTITFRQDLGTINFQLQVRSSSGTINFDANDYKWIWVFKI